MELYCECSVGNTVHETESIGFCSGSDQLNFDADPDPEPTEQIPIMFSYFFLKV